MNAKAHEVAVAALDGPGRLQRPEQTGGGRLVLSHHDWRLIQIAATRSTEDEEAALDALLRNYLSVHGFHETLTALGGESEEALACVRSRKDAQLICIGKDFAAVEARHADELPALLRLKLILAAVRSEAASERSGAVAFDSISTRAAALALQCASGPCMSLFADIVGSVYNIEANECSPDEAAALAAEVNGALLQNMALKGVTDASVGESSLELLLRWHQWGAKELVKGGIDAPILQLESSAV